MNKIELEKLTKIYKFEKRNLQIPILLGIDATFDSSRLNFILGASGSGKSTLLQILAGELEYDAGALKIENKLDFNAKSNIVLLRQNPLQNILPNSTILQNFTYVASFNKIKHDTDVYKNILQNLHLKIPLNKKVSELSTGQIQRLGVGLVLFRNPEILLLDEPTSHLDKMNALNTIKVIEQHSINKKCLTIIATHDQKLAKEHKQFLLHKGVFTPYLFENLIDSYRDANKYLLSEKNNEAIGIIEITCKINEGNLIIPQTYYKLIEAPFYSISKYNKIITIRSDVLGNIKPNFLGSNVGFDLNLDLTEVLIQIDIGMKEIRLEMEF